MSTKYFDLFSALKAGGVKGVSPAALTKALKFSASSLAVYVHALRHKFGANIESVRNGRTVVTYRLLNVAEMESKISPNRKPRTSKKKATVAKSVQTVSKTAKTATHTRKSKKNVIAPVVDDMSVVEINDSDLSDIKSQLGIA
jgi:biotin operon repressor